MRILFFGRYDTDYSRNAVLMKGLRLNGVDVVECRVDPSARFWPLRLVWRYLRERPAFDVMLVAFPGQEVMLIARWLTRKPIIFDAFTSHYEGYVEDRKTVAVGSARAYWYALLDRYACMVATAALTDTREHARYWHERFNVPVSKLYPVLLGTPVIPEKTETEHAAIFTVHFHGSNIPLQGIEVIWGAVRRLWNEDVRFQIVGPFEVPNELASKVVHERYLPLPELVARMRRSHVSLGIFGHSAKTERVIPNKVYEALSCGLPVITADTPAIRELLCETDGLLIRKADADALARAIMEMKSDVDLRRRMAEAGHARLLERATPAMVGASVLRVVKAIT